MFGKRYTVLRLFGFDVHIDLSWLIIVSLVVWSLGAGLFPLYYPNLETSDHWTMAGFGALGLFASIVFHELSHSLVARRHGLPITGITLFVFGGVAEMDEEPRSARTEFLMAVAGPLSSLLLAGTCFAVLGLGRAWSWPLGVTGVVGYLAWINLILAVFNLVPAFPLDGGRILRSLLWRWRGDLRTATRWASTAGSVFGLALILVGGLAVLSGSLLPGVWWVFIGLFIRQAAQMSYQQVLVREALEGEPVRRFMHVRPAAVDAQTPLDTFVEQFVYQHQLKLFAVVDQDRLMGVVELKDVKRIPREQWSSTPVSAITRPAADDLTVGPDDDAMAALTRMQRRQRPRLLVMDQGRLVGTVSLRDLMARVALQLELEPEARGSTQWPWSGGAPAGPGR